MSNRLEAAPNFCAEFVESAGDLASFAPWFVGAALLLGVAYGIIEAIRKAAPQAPKALSSGTLKELLQALQAFIQALAGAPAWLALVGIGFLLILVPGALPSDRCAAEMNQTYWNADGAAPTNSTAKQ